MLLVALCALGVAAFSAGMLRAISAQIPELDPARAAQNQANTYVYASDGTSVLAVLRGSQARVVVPADQISPWIRHATVAIEDKRFYDHHGVDLRGIARATLNDLRGRPVQGGSTITQQFVKQQLTGSAETFGRKLRDAALAWQLEQQWPKDKILTAYLNTIFYGNGAYGVQEASKVYFGENASQLTVPQAALLAGIPQNPTLWDPVAHPDHARARRNLVLRQLYLQGYILAKEYRQYIAAKMPDPRQVRLPATSNSHAPYFANYVTGQLVQHYKTSDKVYGGGLKVTTTIDLHLQKLAEQAVDKILPPSIGPSAALVSIDAHTGAVLAMVGGRDYNSSQFNLATQGERQPGSAFKPFVLAAALRAGISPSTILNSHPVTIDTGGRLWNVNNFEGEYLGPINLSKAIAASDNSVFAQLTNIVGPANVVKTAKAMGITTPLQNYFAIGLGAEPATPIEMARAYTTLADGGYRIDDALNGDEPRAIASIADGNGKTIFDNSALPQAVSGLEGDGAAIEDQMLEGVVTSGTGTAAAIPGRTIAGKTGTTENYGDAWFVGFTPDVVTAVWVGYPDRLVPMLSQFHGHAVTGGTFPALIWKAYMQKALAYLNEPVDSFPEATYPYSTASDVLYRNNKLEVDNGNCRNTNLVEFFDGSTPSTVANCKPNEVDVPNVRGMTYESAKARLLLQPLLTSLRYRAAKTGQRVGYVVRQSPPNGTLSSYDKVTLWVVHSTHGVVPKLVGLPLGQAQAKLAKLKVQVEVSGAPQGRVVAQRPASGVAAGPGMQVVLTVAPQKAG